ncbi:hypothetical protein PIB30_015175 [Stylosanthes scabra]|uniref:Uncharacterized protein n=1 Tax=Stylosanthes scabra TaxID=79078 RepID=A0ABU6U776_9FABA|nr:hypothetical protein [Stylosanthes scabra]
MAQDMFHFIVYVNGSIIQGENGASFQSDAPLMFRNTRVSTLWEFKQLILSHLRAVGPAITPDDRLEYRPSWLSDDRHVWIMFEMHRRIMQDRFMEFFAKVRHVGGSGGFRPYQVPAEPASINIIPLDYNSDTYSDYKDQSSGYSTERDELVLPAPKPIPDLVDVPSFFQQLDIDVRHVEDPTLECSC